MAHYHSSTPVDTVIEKVKRHPKYFLQGGDIHFLVETHLFRVHRYFFERESGWFRKNLAVPAPAGQSPRGSTETNPFPLDDIRSDDFERFLWVFYNPKYSMYDAHLDDWKAIVKLASDWCFAEVKKLCQREFEKFDIAPLDKIELYQMYELDKKLLIPSYIEICVRPQPLSVKEGRQIGLETSLLLATARECARGILDNGARSPGPVRCQDDDMVNVVSDVFGLNAIVSPSLLPVRHLSSPTASRFDPSISPSKSPYTYSTLGSASATAVKSVFAGDVFSPASTAPNGAAATGQSNSSLSPPPSLSRLTSTFQPQEPAQLTTELPLKTSQATTPVDGRRNPSTPVVEAPVSTAKQTNATQPQPQAQPQLTPPPPPKPMGKGRKEEQAAREARVSQEPPLQNSQETMQLGQQQQMSGKRPGAGTAPQAGTVVGTGRIISAPTSSDTKLLQSLSRSQSGIASTADSAGTSLTTSQSDRTTPAGPLADTTDESAETSSSSGGIADAGATATNTAQAQASDATQTSETAETSGAPQEKLSKSQRRAAKLQAKKMANAAQSNAPSPIEQNAPDASPSDNSGKSPVQDRSADIPPSDTSNSSTPKGKEPRASESLQNASAAVVKKGDKKSAGTNNKTNASAAAQSQSPASKVGTSVTPAIPHASGNATDASSTNGDKKADNTANDKRADGSVAAQSIDVTAAAETASSAKDVSSGAPSKDGDIKTDDPTVAKPDPSVPTVDATTAVGIGAPAPPAKDAAGASPKDGDEETPAANGTSPDASVPAKSDQSTPKAEGTVAAETAASTPTSTEGKAPDVPPKSDEKETLVAKEKNESPDGAGTSSAGEEDKAEDDTPETGGDAQRGAESSGETTTGGPTGTTPEPHKGVSTGTGAGAGASAKAASVTPPDAPSNQTNAKANPADKNEQQAPGIVRGAWGKPLNAGQQSTSTGRPQTPERAKLAVNTNAWGVGRGAGARSSTPSDSQKPGEAGGRASAKTASAGGRGWGGFMDALLGGDRE